MKQSDVMIRMLEIRDEARAVIREKGRAAAADYISTEQYKLVGVMLDNGLLNAAQAVELVAEIDGHKAEFLRRGEE